MDNKLLYGSLKFIKQDGSEGGVFPLSLGTINIGSSADAAIRIKSTELEPFHCSLTVDNRGIITLRNLARRNGVKLNGLSVVKNKFLVPGDTLTILKKTLRYENDYLQSRVLKEIETNKTPLKGRHSLNIGRLQRRKSVIPTPPPKKNTPLPMSKIKRRSKSLAEKMETRTAAESPPKTPGLRSSIRMKMTSGTFLVTKTPSAVPSRRVSSAQIRKEFTVATPNSTVKPTLRNADEKASDVETGASVFDTPSNLRNLRTPVAEDLPDDEDVVTTPINNSSVVFIDTPLKEDATKMRSQKNKSKLALSESLIVIDSPYVKTPKTVLNTSDKTPKSSLRKTKLIAELMQQEATTSTPATNKKKSIIVFDETLDDSEIADKNIQQVSVSSEEESDDETQNIPASDVQTRKRKRTSCSDDEEKQRVAKKLHTIEKSRISNQRAMTEPRKHNKRQFRRSLPFAKVNQSLECGDSTVESIDTSSFIYVSGTNVKRTRNSGLVRFSGGSEVQSPSDRAARESTAADLSPVVHNISGLKRLGTPAKTPGSLRVKVLKATKVLEEVDGFVDENEVTPLGTRDESKVQTRRSASIRTKLNLLDDSPYACKMSFRDDVDISLEYDKNELLGTPVNTPRSLRKKVSKTPTVLGHDETSDDRDITFSPDLVLIESDVKRLDTPAKTPWSLRKGNSKMLEEVEELNTDEAESSVDDKTPNSVDLSPVLVYNESGAKRLGTPVKTPRSLRKRVSNAPVLNKITEQIDEFAGEVEKAVDDSPFANKLFASDNSFELSPVLVQNVSSTKRLGTPARRSSLRKRVLNTPKLMKEVQECNDETGTKMDDSPDNMPISDDSVESSPGLVQNESGSKRLGTPIKRDSLRKRVLKTPKVLEEVQEHNDEISKEDSPFAYEAPIVSSPNFAGNSESEVESTKTPSSITRKSLRTVSKELEATPEVEDNNVSTTVDFANNNAEVMHVSFRRSGRPSRLSVARTELDSAIANNSAVSALNTTNDAQLKLEQTLDDSSCTSSIREGGIPSTASIFINEDKYDSVESSEENSTPKQSLLVKLSMSSNDAEVVNKRRTSRITNLSNLTEPEEQLMSASVSKIEEHLESGVLQKHTTPRESRRSVRVSTIVQLREYNSNAPIIQDESENDLSKEQNEPLNDSINPKLVPEPDNDLTSPKALKKLMRSPKEQKEPLNDLSNPVGVKKLMRTPKVMKEPKNDLTSPKGVKKLMRTPKAQKEPLNDLSNPLGVKKLMKTPKEQKGPKNDLTSPKGVKKLLRTPKAQKEPLNDLSNPLGVKKLMKTPKEQKEPKNDLTSPKGVKKLMRTPKAQKEPLNDLSNPLGVKKLMKTPKEQKEPKNDLTSPKGVKKLMRTLKAQKEPLNDLTNPLGVKKLMRTPKVMKEPENDITNPVGLKKLMATPKVQKEPLNDLSNPLGLKKLMQEPKEHKEPKNDLTNPLGVKALLRTPKEQKEPLNDLSNPLGLKQLMRTPRVVKEPENDLCNVSGIGMLFASDEESIFPKQLKTYGKTSLKTNEDDAVQVAEISSSVEKPTTKRTRRNVKEVNEASVVDVTPRAAPRMGNEEVTQQPAAKKGKLEIAEELVSSPLRPRRKRNVEVEPTSPLSTRRNKPVVEEEIPKLETRRGRRVKDVPTPQPSTPNTRSGRNRNGNQSQETEIEKPTITIEQVSNSAVKRGRKTPKSQGTTETEEARPLRRNRKEVLEEVEELAGNTSTTVARRGRRRKNEQDESEQVEKKIKQDQEVEMAHETTATTRGRRGRKIAKSEIEETEVETDSIKPPTAGRGRRRKADENEQAVIKQNASDDDGGSRPVRGTRRRGQEQKEVAKADEKIEVQAEDSRDVKGKRGRKKKGDEKAEASVEEKTDTETKPARRGRKRAAVEEEAANNKESVSKRANSENEEIKPRRGRQKKVDERNNEEEIIIAPPKRQLRSRK